MGTKPDCRDNDLYTTLSKGPTMALSFISQEQTALASPPLWCEIRNMLLIVTAIR